MNQSARRHSRCLALAALLPLLSCAPPVPVPLTPSPPAEEPVPERSSPGRWWAVRLDTGDEPAAAHDRASEASRRFDEPVTVVESGGAWHVQVGACTTEAQARGLASLARARGYRSASVVTIPPPEPAPQGLAAPPAPGKGP